MSSSSSSTTSILDRNVAKPKADVALSSFAFLFSELVQYHHARVSHMNDLESRLSEVGYQVGARVLELLTYRDKNSKRETKLLSMLSFIASTVWKTLFGRTAELERSSEHDNVYMIVEQTSIVNKFISVPKDIREFFTASSFVAGIVGGILDSSGFSAEVTAQFRDNPDDPRQPFNLIVMTFADEVIEREK